MNKDKWVEIFLKEVRQYEKDNNINVLTTPDKWAEEKQKLLKLVANVDKATEVYNLENNIKG